MEAEEQSGISWELASRVLRVTVALQCVGLYRIASIDGTGIGDTLFHTLGVSESVMLAVEMGIAWFCMIAGLATLVFVSRILLGIIASWFFVVAVLDWYQGGFFTPGLVIPAHAVRYLAPVGLAWLHHSLGREASPGSHPTLHAESLLRVAAAVTFVAHGIEALLHNPIFVDYIIRAANYVEAGLISQSVAESMLTLIGIVDLAVAVALVTRRWKSIAAYMAFWGIITALSRIVHQGWPKWPATLVRVANGGIPLALYVYWRRRQPDEDVGSGEA